MTAGYSGTPLPAELGIKAGTRVLLDGARDDVPVDGRRRPGRDPYDVVLLFAPDAVRLHAR